MLVSISQLSDLTGRSRKTVQQKCDDLEATKGKRGAIQYESKDALPRILGIADEDTERLDYAKENALLAREKRKKITIEREILEGRLIETETVIETWQQMVSAMKSRLLQLPSEGAQAAIVATELYDIEEALREVVYQALTELSNDGIPTDIAKRYSSGNGEDSCTTTKADGDGMGRPVQETKRGSKRKARTMAN